MSKTIRRKNATSNGWTDLDWYISETIYPFEEFRSWVSVILPYPKDSREYKKGKARFHSDGETSSCKEPGPSWFRNLYTERPMRRQAKRELQKFMLDPNYEPIVEEKGKLEYWT
jgi:hypothetical protein